MELLIDKGFAPGRVLNDEESAHCVKVMRHRVGDVVHVGDGAGKRYECRLAKADARGCELDVLSVEERERSGEIWMAVAPTKNIDRFEWFVEKAVEIGVGRITPLLCEHSERDRVRVDRLEKIVLAASKQSLKYWLPIVDDLTGFSDLMAMDSPEGRFILHCEEGDKRHLFASVEGGRDTLVLVGPEGDFSKGEIETALAKGYRECTLGDERLRTETAAIVATEIVALRSQV